MFRFAKYYNIARTREGFQDSVTDNVVFLIFFSDSEINFLNVLRQERITSSDLNTYLVFVDIS